MFCMKKVRFSSCPTAKLRCHRPLGAAQVTASPVSSTGAEPRLSSDAMLHHFFEVL